MSRLMDFLGDANTPVAFATSDDNKPSVRFVSFKMVVDGELYFCTSKKKGMYKQLEKNNLVEVCSLPNEKREWARFTANVEFVQDLELSKKAFEVLPLLEMAYKTPENEDFVLLKMVNIDAKKQSLASGEEKIEL